MPKPQVTQSKKLSGKVISSAQTFLIHRARQFVPSISDKDSGKRSVINLEEPIIAALSSIKPLHVTEADR